MHAYRDFYWNPKTGVTQWTQPSEAELKGENIVHSTSGDDAAKGTQLAGCSDVGMDVTVITPCSQIDSMGEDWRTLQVCVCACAPCLFAYT